MRGFALVAWAFAVGISGVVGTRENAAGATRTYPGPECSATLQACIDGAASGDTIEIGTTTPIAESPTIVRSLTLTGAPGMTPVIGGASSVNVLSVQNPGGGPDASATLAVSIRGITFSNAQIGVELDLGAGHTIEVRDCTVSHSYPTNAASGISITARTSPVTATVAHNTVTTTGDAIQLRAYGTGGPVTFTAVGNRLSGSNPTYAHSGIDVDVQGAATATVNLWSNVVHDESGCACGGAAGMSVNASSPATATVHIVNDTIDHVAASGIGTSPLTGTLALDIVNDVVTRCGGRGVALIASAGLSVENAFNDFFMNGAPNDFGGFAEGGSTFTVDPRFVDAAGGDYQLASGSPMIDTGTNGPPGGLPDVDAAGDVRVAGAAVDIGAYEFGAGPPTTTTTSTTTTTLPGCVAAPTLASVDCRLAALGVQVDADVPAGRLHDGLASAVGKARRFTMQSATDSGRAARRALGKAIRMLGGFARHVKRTHRIAADIGKALIDAARSIAADLHTLRGA